MVGQTKPKRYNHIFCRAVKKVVFESAVAENVKDVGEATEMLNEGSLDFKEYHEQDNEIIDEWEEKEKK